jgi:hypothetical protein
MNRQSISYSRMTGSFLSWYGFVLGIFNHTNIISFRKRRQKKCVCMCLCGWGGGFFYFDMTRSCVALEEGECDANY